MMKEKNIIIPHKHSVNRTVRNGRNGHQSKVLWFTGFSGSGKSTISNVVEQKLFADGIHTYLMDGDNIRTGLNKGLGFSEEDRAENLRRIAEVAKLFVDAGVMVLCAFVSPLKSDRDLVKSIIGEDDFVEIFINTSLEECEKRDVKGLYEKARKGEIKNFTGISAPYEAPENPDILVNTENTSVEDNVAFVFNEIQKYIK